MRKTLKSCALALLAVLCLALGSRFDKPVRIFDFARQHADDLPQVAVARFKALLAGWRQGLQRTGMTKKSNLIASSNHFVMSAKARLPEDVGWQAA